LKSAHGDRFKIHACPLAAQLYGAKKEDLVELVEDIRGAEYFLEEVYGGLVMYL
jgi:peroxiredoxin family protein